MTARRLQAFTAVAPYDGLVAALRERFGGLGDRVALAFPRGTPEGLAHELLSDVGKIPAAFMGWS